MANATTTLQVHVDEDLRQKAAKTFDAMGLTITEAVRVFLTRAADGQSFPIEPHLPNATTVAAMNAGDRGEVESFEDIDALMASLHAHD
jgi:DNA-damage-inducible protein J